MMLAESSDPDVIIPSGLAVLNSAERKVSYCYDVECDCSMVWYVCVDVCHSLSQA